MFIQTEFIIDEAADTLIVGHDFWDTYTVSDELKKWRADTKISYIWDNMINILYNYHIKGNKTSFKRKDIEETVRYINLESRNNRIELGYVLDDARKKNIKARIVVLEGKNCTYVFMPLNNDNWKNKEKELQMRCFVARVLNPDIQKVIGITIGNASNKDSWFDIVYLNRPNLVDEDYKDAERIKNELGYFKDLEISRSKERLKERLNLKTNLQN